jgi:hypothetical protein
VYIRDLTETLSGAIIVQLPVFKDIDEDVRVGGVDRQPVYPTKKVGFSGVFLILHLKSFFALYSSGFDNLKLTRKRG